MQWDMKISIEVFMSRDTNESQVQCVISSASLSYAVCVCVCMFEWLDYYLIECIFVFTLTDVNTTFRDPSVEHTCITII